MDPATAPTLAVHQFQAKWRDHVRRERASSQEHFIDLCRLVGSRTPAEADPDGSFFTFEKSAQRSDGRPGFADVWYRGRFAWEYKGLHGDLDKAFQQLQRYRENLENPRLLVVSDMDVTRVHTNFTDAPPIRHEFNLESLDQPKALEVLRAVFHDPDLLDPKLSREAVTQDAAARIGELAIRLERRGVEAPRAAHFLVQIVFCLFAEDVGLLERGLFTNLLRLSLAHPSRFASRLEDLFSTMRDGGDFGPYAIAWFNGGLFSWIATEDLKKDEIAILAEAAELDWSGVEPAIFGTLFERSLDPEKRKELGLQYTPRQEIERVVQPVVIEPLRHRWEEVRQEADELKQRWDSEREKALRKPRGTSGTRKNPDTARKAFEAKLAAFQEELSRVRVLDPACGSGNFLYVALAALMGLEKEVSGYGAANGLSFAFPLVRPCQLAGLEINDYARELAQVVVWIGYLQWMRENGFDHQRDPVLQPLETIDKRNALLDRRDGRVSEAEWPAADFIVGNPPFLGGKQMRSGLGDQIVDDLFSVYAGRVPREADLVCYWFEKARAEIAAGRAKRVGLLATQAIRGGANRRVLERIKRSGEIFMAWDSEDWPLGRANVNISIVGFDDGSEQMRTIDGVPVATINADLTGAVDVTKAQQLPENRGIAFMGDTKGGPFDVPGRLARGWLALPVNPNGRPNSDVVRPWVNGLDITRRPRDMWIVDFGVDMPEREAALYEAPFEHIREQVKPVREKSRAQDAQWWRHLRPRPDMRSALQGLQRFIVTPTIAKHRVFAWVDRDMLPDHQLIAFARQDDYFFGVLHSRAHEVWSLRMGTALEDRPRYTPTTCFETFPFPSPTTEQRAAIGAAAKVLNDMRQSWLNPLGSDSSLLTDRTLTKLYNQRPALLAYAHADLDRAVWAAYGWDDRDPAVVEEEIILSRLLALNLLRTVGADRTTAVSQDDHLVEPAASHPGSSSESSPFTLPTWIPDSVPVGEISEPDAGSVQAASG